MYLKSGGLDMLVIVSDLHFTDETAGRHNVPAGAFDIFFEDLASTIRWHRKKGRAVDSLSIVFLGDIFDLLRTTYWLGPQIKESERPWGSRREKTKAHAGHIFNRIAEKNADALAILSGALKDRFELPFEPERIYVPGNHDRLCNLFSGLRGHVRTSLGIAPSEAPFAHVFNDGRYGVIARHGHEFDKFNYEGGTGLDRRAHMAVPIGDPITTEIVTKFPWKVMQAPKVRSLPEKHRNRLEKNLQQIDDVRPFSAMLQWLLYQVGQFRVLKPVIEDCVDDIVRQFNKLSFVRRWYDHHDKWTDFADEADQIQAVLFLLEKFKVFPTERLLPLVDRIAARLAGDELAEGAKRENQRFRYVVYGHSHSPMQIPLRTVRSHRDGANGSEQVYINTGTWRSRYHRTIDSEDFIGWKNMTYAIFYTAAERGAEIPGFETWSGTLKTG